jgi:hypothetical protein
MIVIMVVVMAMTMRRWTPQFRPSVRVTVRKKTVTRAVRSLLGFERSRFVSYGEPECHNHGIEHVIGKIGNLAVRNLERDMTVAQVVSRAQ